jgi:hypothetical protein
VSAVKSLLTPDTRHLTPETFILKIDPHRCSTGCLGVLPAGMVPEES